MFSRLDPRILGHLLTKRTISEGETPFESKNWNFGESLLSALQARMLGNLLTMLLIWAWVNPFLVKKAMTESGF